MVMSLYIVKYSQTGQQTTDRQTNKTRINFKVQLSVVQYVNTCRRFHNDHKFSVHLDLNMNVQFQ